MVKFVKGAATATTSSGSSPIAFDGMSCKAFKLEKLSMGQQAQRLVAFEASRTDSVEKQRQAENI